MQLILNDPAAWGSIVALVLLFGIGSYYIVRFLKSGHR